MADKKGDIMKTLLLTLTLLITGSAWAEWVRVDGNESLSIYIDSATIRKDGNFRKAWELQDLKQRHKGGELSRRMKTEYDCKQERSRILSFTTHSGSMAEGDILFSSETGGTWIDAPPKTMSETILRVVCAK